MRRSVEVEGRATCRQPRRLCRELANDRRGSALIYTTICLPVLMGFALLAIDASRFMNLHSHLQHGGARSARCGIPA